MEQMKPKKEVVQGDLFEQKASVQEPEKASPLDVKYGKEMLDELYASTPDDHQRGQWR